MHGNLRAAALAACAARAAASRARTTRRSRHRADERRARTRRATRRPRRARSRARDVDDDADAPLRDEAAAEHHEVERRVRAAGQVAAEAFVQHREAEHVDRGAEAVQRPPQVAARESADRMTRQRGEVRPRSPPRRGGARGRRAARAACRTSRARRSPRAIDDAHRTAGDRAAAARVSPSTSISHGTAHRPWIAMNEPMPNAAERRDPPEARMPEARVRTPAHCAREAARHCAGLGDVRHAPRDRSATTSRSRRRARRRSSRQRVMRSAHSSGVVAASAPRPPATMIQPRATPAAPADTTSRAPSAAPSGTRTRRAPITARANASPAKRFGVREEQRAAGAAMASSTGSTRRGPIAVEQHADRHLHRAERQEIRARQQAERRRIERQVARPGPAR